MKKHGTAFSMRPAKVYQDLEITIFTAIFDKMLATVFNDALKHIYQGIVNYTLFRQLENYRDI